MLTRGTMGAGLALGLFGLGFLERSKLAFLALLAKTMRD